MLGPMCRVGLRAIESYTIGSYYPPSNNVIILLKVQVLVGKD